MAWCLKCVRVVDARHDQGELEFATLDFQLERVVIQKERAEPIVAGRRCIADVSGIVSFSWRGPARIVHIVQEGISQKYVLSSIGVQTDVQVCVHSCTPGLAAATCSDMFELIVVGRDDTRQGGRAVATRPQSPRLVGKPARGAGFLVSGQTLSPRAGGA